MAVARSVVLTLTRGIPDVPAEVTGFFRVFYAAFLFVALANRRLKLDELVSGDRSLTWSWLDWWLSRPAAVARLEDALLLLLVLFAIGLCTRVAYALMAAGLTLWIVIMLQPASTNIHVWEVAFLTVLCLLPVPWGAAFSVDETLRRWRGKGVGAGHRGKRFGFPLWMPGFILGAVWAGAAYSKIEQSGLDWIVGGAVKYHWVIDAPLAPVSWGLWVASHPWASVTMSFLGVALEATFIFVPFLRPGWMRTLLAALVGGGLIAGFFLFQGVLWWTWGLVLASFLIPWPTIFNGVSSLVPKLTCRVDLSRPDGRRRLRFWHGLDWFNKLTFVDLRTNEPVEPERTSRALQMGPLRPVHGLVPLVIALLMVREYPEGIGRFTSYSNTYASTADFDAHDLIDSVEHLWIGYRTLAAVEVFRGSNEAQVLKDAIRLLSSGERLPSPDQEKLRLIRETLARDYGNEVDRVTFVREGRRFDWSAGRFVSAGNEVVGTLDLRTFALSADGE